MNALTEHGGRTDVAARLYPHAPQPWLDLSTGINPVAWDGDVPLVDLRALPSPDALAALEAAAAAAFGIAPDLVAALPGTEIGLRSLDRLGLPAPHRYVVPSYGTHAAVWPDAEAIGIDDLTVAAGGTTLIANPNNPDGRAVSTAELSARSGWLVVDEAFGDVVPGASVLPRLTPDDPVLVFRSFGKFFGLAGVRLGFVCGNADAVRRMRALLGSWPVSATAIAIGTAAYRDRAWIAATRMRLTASAAALDTVLHAHGLKPRGACPLFRLVETDDAAALFERLARSGILTRAFVEDPRRLRFGLPAGPAERDRLDRALRG